MKDLRIYPLREAEAPGWEETKTPFVCLVLLGLFSIVILAIITVLSVFRGTAAGSAGIKRSMINSLHVSHRRSCAQGRAVQSLAK